MAPPAGTADWNERARALWARTTLRVWPENYVLASLPVALRGEAAALLAGSLVAFAALVVEKHEASLTLLEAAWNESELRHEALGVAGPYRAITLDLAVDLDVCGYLAPAARCLAEARVPIVPQCAYARDHLLVHERDLARAVAALEELMRAARG